MTNSEIIQMIYSAIDDFNAQNPAEMHLAKAEDTVLFGRHGKLDSIGLVNLIVAVEEKLDDEYDISLTLANEKAMSEKRSPFQSISSLTEYIAALVAEQADG